MMSSQAYQGAVALSNMAVTLHERRCYRPAFETLQDAVFLMRLACRPDEQLVDVQDKVHAALYRLAVPIPSKKRDMPFMNLTSLSFDGSSADGWRAVDNLGSSSTRAVLIRIDQSPQADERDMEVDSAVILHNYGLACLYQALQLARFGRRTILADKLRNNAFRILNLSQSMLSARAARPDTDEVLLTYVLFAGVIVTHSLALALQSTGTNSTDVIDCQTRLSDLKAVLKEMPPVSSTMAAAAAAAA